MVLGQIFETQNANKMSPSKQLEVKIKVLDKEILQSTLRNNFHSFLLIPIFIFLILELKNLELFSKYLTAGCIVGLIKLWEMGLNINMAFLQIFLNAQPPAAALLLIQAGSLCSTEQTPLIPLF